MDILTKEVSEATQKKFNVELADKITLIHFTQEPSRLVPANHLMGQECMFCKETKALLKEVCSLSGKLELVLYDFSADVEKAEEFNITKIPATLITNEKTNNLRFFGIPSGYEYMSLIEAIVDVSKGSTSLKPDTKEALKDLTADIHIQTFVTPTCPYCTMSVRIGHQMALESPRITADMIEATEFPHLAHKYNVAGVPRTVLNETVAIEGAVPEETFLEHVLKAGHPEEKASSSRNR
jgi:glutaredoxin-like protein